MTLSHSVFCYIFIFFYYYNILFYYIYWLITAIFCFILLEYCRAYSILSTVENAHYKIIDIIIIIIVVIRATKEDYFQ